MNKAGVLAIITLLLLEFASLHIVRSDIQWINVSNSVVPTVALYDIDGDGSPEIVTPSFIIDDKGVLQIQMSQVIKYDYDGDGKLDLLLYRSSDGQLVAFINSVSYVYSAPAGSEVIAYSNGLKVGDRILSHGKELILPADAKSVAPIYRDGTLGAVYIDANGNLIYYDGNTKVLIYLVTTDYTIIDATAISNKIYVALSTQQQIAVLITYDIVSRLLSIKIIGGEVTWGRFVLSQFIYQVRNTVYAYDLESGKVSVLGNAVSRIIYPILNPSSFAIVSLGLIKIYVNGTSSPLTYPAPPGVEVYLVDIDGDILVVTTSGGIYVYGRGVPSLDVSAPATAFVSEPIAINLTGTFDYAYITVDGRKYDFYLNPVVIIINEPGIHNITATACKNLICVSKTVWIAVVTKTMNISVSAPNVVEPYSQLEINITITDSGTGKPVDATCRVRISDIEDYYTATQGKINIATVAVPKGAEIPIVVECFATGYTGSSTSLSIPLSSYYYTVDLVYIGGGVFTIRAYNIYTGEPFDGVIEATVDGRPVPVTKNKLVVGPGNHTVVVILKIDNAVVGRYTWTVTYYPDISQVPPGQQVIIGDRVREVTTTATFTKTTTVPVPVTIETINIPMAVGIFMFGLGLGLAILFLQGQIQKRRTGV